jgi:hypothetical protein
MAIEPLVSMSMAPRSQPSSVDCDDGLGGGLAAGPLLPVVACLCEPRRAYSAPRENRLSADALSLALVTNKFSEELAQHQENKNK